FGGESASFHTRIEEGLSLPEMADFASRVEQRARELDPGSNLTAAQIGARAEFGATCVGCHHRLDRPLSRDLGQNLTLPVVDIPPGDQDIKSFTQVNNREFEPCAANGTDQSQSCYLLSPALREIFLPKRKETLERYLQFPGTFGPLPNGQSSTKTVSGTPVTQSN
ncbi:MAG TPA: hypothetical protein VFQ61_15510, partial [Polyangiaceae bacterium]|nr:hypothetical protein [Polyangiaceae bacterium]